MRSISLFSSLVLLGLLAKFATVVYGADQCKHRSFGHESTVCVCDEKSCDSLEPLKKTEPGVVQTFSTSRGGDRFAREDVHFEKELSANGHLILLHPDQTMQKITGFGGALTDISGENFFQLPEKLQQNLIRDYFGNEGIEYSSIRVPIGGTNMSERRYTLDDHSEDDFDFEFFKLSREDLNWKIPILQMIQKITPHLKSLKTFAAGFNSPGWMSQNDGEGDGGSLKGGPGGECYKAYARYLTLFLQQYQQQHNISFWGLTIVNEPRMNYYASLKMTAEQQRDFIKKDLGPELHRQGLDKIKLMIFDWNVPQMRNYVGMILRDKEAMKYVSGIAYHWYETDQLNRKILEETHQKWPNQFIMSTEASEQFYSDSLGVWHTARNYADDIIKSLKNSVSGWVDWNLMVDTKGGPNWVSQHLNAPVIINATSKKYYKQPAFYAMGHFSKFLPPDSIRFNHTGQEVDSIYDMVAFQRPDGGRVVILLNHGYDVENFTMVDPQHGMVKFPLKGQSIKTLLWY